MEVSGSEWRCMKVTEIECNGVEASGGQWK